jgi:voltage-gated potassium channel
MPVEKSAQTIDEIADQISSIKLWELPFKTLEKLDKYYLREQEIISNNVLELQEDLSNRLSANDASTLEKSRNSLRFLKAKHESLEIRRESLNDAIEMRHMELGMIEKFRTKNNYRLHESILFYVIIGILSLITYDLLFNNDIEISKKIFWIDVGCCLYFIVDLTLRFRSCNSSKWFWKRYWLDILTSIPVPPAGQMIRFGRFARLIRLLRAARSLRVFLFMWRGLDKLHDVINVPLMKKSLKVGVFMIFLGAVVMTWTEGKGDNPVSNLFDSVWWSFISIFTGAFGPIYNPQTLIGRLVTVLLVICGMMLIGIFTATLTSLYMDDETDELAHNQERMEEKLDKIERLLEEKD